MSIWKELRKQKEKRCNKQALPPVRGFATKKSADYFELTVQLYAAVAALVATVTFTAILTMPGGYDQHRGFAILSKKPAFTPFVLSNTIAMCSSIVLLLCFVWSWRDPVRFKLYQLKWGHRLTILTCLSMVVSLMTAVHLVVGPELRWLSIVVSIIGCSTPIVALLLLGPEILFVSS